MIYLDNAATSWPKPEVVYRAVDVCQRNGGSPGRGGHSQALLAGRILFNARESIAALWQISDSSRISFALNATDAINTALLGSLKTGDTVVTTSIEHNAVARPLRFLESQGVLLRIVKCLPDGSLSIDDLAAALADEPAALVMAHASNVTGIVRPLEAIKARMKSKTLLIIDAAQTAGVENVEAEALGVDMLAASGHKGMLGPQGTGCLYVRQGISLRPARYGGTGSMSESDIQPTFMPDSLESGTQNTPGIAGLAAGVEFIRQTGIEVIARRERMLARELADELRRIKGVRILGWEVPEQQTAVVSAVFEGFDNSLFAKQLAEREIACRAGLHCAPWAHLTLGTLSTGAVRFSPGFFTTEQEIEQTVSAIKTIIEKGS